LFGLIATGVSWAFLPAFFTSTQVAVVYGVLMAFAMCVSNIAELRVWATAFGTARVNNQAWRLAIRLGIYLLVPILLIYGISFTGAFTLANGLLTAFALTWMP